ncbi:hypothetical protein M885DRAFT_563219 [Pelagophyceae sp. CCMP2097]|nr:hypothetical protein M885DRAFT_563219 [Pelagophyceae sp. CCMP2097]
MEATPGVDSLDDDAESRESAVSSAHMREAAPAKAAPKKGVDAANSPQARRGASQPDAATALPMNRDAGVLPRLHVGDRVEAQFGRGDIAFQGCVAKVCDGGRSYDVEYDDGDVEMRLPARFVRLAPPTMIAKGYALAQPETGARGEAEKAGKRGKATSFEPAGQDARAAGQDAVSPASEAGALPAGALPAAVSVADQGAASDVDIGGGDLNPFGIAERKTGAMRCTI